MPAAYQGGLGMKDPSQEIYIGLWWTPETPVLETD